MRSRYKQIQSYVVITGLTLLTSQLTSYAEVYVSEPYRKERITGGTFVDLSGTAITELSIDGGTCTGTLVGPRHVLTAAHCVADTSPEDTYAYFNGNWFQAEESWFSAFYDNSLPVLSYNQRYDVGMIILREAPTVSKIFPVIAEPVVGVGTSLIVAGFGKTEFDGAGYSYVAGLTVSNMFAEGLFATYDYIDGAGTCSGDSGGPAIITFSKDSKYAGIGGIVSYGNRYDNYDYCFLDSTAYSAFVNTQSSVVQGFLSNWPEIRKFYPSKFKALESTTLAFRSLKKAKSAKKINNYKTALRAVAKQLSVARKTSGGTLKKLIVTTENMVATALKVQNLRNASKHLAAIGKRLDSVLTAAYPYNY